MTASVTRRTLLGSVGAAAMFPALGSAFRTLPAGAPRPALEASLLVGEPQTGPGGRRTAAVRGGRVTGHLLQGVVQSGQLEWLVDPASGAVELAARVQVRRADGELVELHDRTAHAAEDSFAAQPGWPTAPRLIAAGARYPVTE